METRKTGVMGIVLKSDNFDMEQAVFYCAKLGTFAVVNSEGVGNYLQKKEDIAEGETPTVRVYVADRYEAVEMTWADICEMVQPELIDLSVLVRKFGDRLERNFSLWYHNISGESGSAFNVVPKA